MWINKKNVSKGIKAPFAPQVIMIYMKEFWFFHIPNSRNLYICW
jgi:hypothetical protein